MGEPPQSQFWKAVLGGKVRAAGARGACSRRGKRGLAGRRRQDAAGSRRRAKWPRAARVQALKGRLSENCGEGRREGRRRMQSRRRLGQGRKGLGSYKRPASRAASCLTAPGCSRRLGQVAQPSSAGGPG